VRWPEANVAYATGKHVVVDVDGPEGEAALAELEAKHGHLPPTLTARTARGRHVYFVANGARVRNSAGRLGPHLDVRGQGGYTIVPPSVHESGNRYEWTNRVKAAPLPAWIPLMLAEPARTEAKSADAKIPEGQRNAYLTSLAGAMRRRGMSQSAIEAALLQENALRCDAPLPESEVRRVAQSVARYESGPRTESVNPWATAEGMDTFLSGAEDDAEFLDDENRLLARENVTQIYSPRGLGKTLFALWLAVSLASRGLRVLYIDRDNPRRVTRNRLRSFGATLDTPNLKVITREKCPPLTNVLAWASFPYADYDVVIVDSLDSTAEAVGEQDSAKPARAIAPLLDISRRENEPAVLVLGNTIKSAAHSRGSGVIEDRADIVYEVRDASELKLSGSKPWWEELPPADAGSWPNRASRRKQRDRYRLAFVCSKFRPAEEPEPFVLQIDLRTEPWTVADVTDDVDREGAEAREARKREHLEKMQGAVGILRVEIARRIESGGAGILRKQAETLLMGHGCNRRLSREAINSPCFVSVEVPGKGHPKVIRVRDESSMCGRNAAIVERAKKGSVNGGDFGHPVSMRVAEIGSSDTRINTSDEKGAISANDSFFSSPPGAKNEPLDEERI
jgi:hypothetical protein